MLSHQSRSKRGAAAANVLGMTTQVPVGMIYVTSAASRELDFSGIKVELRNPPKWQFVNAGKPLGDLVGLLSGKGQSTQMRPLGLSGIKNLTF